MDHLTPMGVAAAYLGEMVTEELKTVAADRIVVVAPQEGQVNAKRWRVACGCGQQWR